MSMFGPYYLRVTFKSNEHPFTGGTECSRSITTDYDAINWARNMSATLGNQYVCTLHRREDDGTIGETVAFEDE